MLGIQTYGALFWEILHGWSFTYPEYPQQIVRDKFALVLQNLQIGCPLCQQHYETYIRSHPPALESQEHFSRWMVDFHNDVNRRLGRPEMPWEEAKQRFAYKSNNVKRIHIVYETKSGELLDGRTMMPISSNQLSQITTSVKAVEHKRDTPSVHPHMFLRSAENDESASGTFATTIFLVILIILVLPLMMYGLSRWYKSI